MQQLIVDSRVVKIADLKCAYPDTELRTSSAYAVPILPVT